jgi:thiamine monophosphate kinase
MQQTENDDGEVDDERRIIELSHHRLNEAQFAVPEFAEQLEDRIELRAALARGHEMTFEGRETRRDERLAQGLALRQRASACIDVSDGLLADIGHICVASGMGADLDIESLPSSPALLSLFDAETRHALQLAGGDDYELCFTVADADAPALLGDLARSGCGATRIGRIVAEPGVRVHDNAGNPVAGARRGWEHFTQ